MFIKSQNHNSDINKSQNVDFIAKNVAAYLYVCSILRGQGTARILITGYGRGTWVPETEGYVNEIHSRCWFGDSFGGDLIF